MALLKTETGMINARFYRPVWIPALVATLLLMLALGLLVTMSWRSLERLRPVHGHVAQLGRLQQAGQRLEQILLDSLAIGARLDRKQLGALSEDLATLPGLNRGPDAQTLMGLRAVAEDPSVSEQEVSEAAVDALLALRHLLFVQIQDHDHLMRTIGRDTQVELKMAIALFVGFPLLGVFALFLLRHRILRPLNDLGALMALLAEREFSPAPAGEVDPLLRPLFDNYNDTVRRLSLLESQHQERESTLEKEVRAATEALLDQSRALARSERLAAVGEVAAGLAHELRNPLAGIQLACSKLRRQLTDPAHVQRLDLVNGEINRLTRLLNDLLNQVREAPEPARDLVLADTVGSLLSLVRFQVPPKIRLENAVAPDLRCHLPEGHLRQALLNLVLNASQALGDDPGTITVEASADGEALGICVCDDGPGFPAELLRTGVRAFSTWRENGTGLGLAMVRRFARDLGGDLELANKEAGGASARLRFESGVIRG